MGLTRQQKWRIKKVQTERIIRAEKTANNAQKLIGNNAQTQTGLVIVRYGQRLLVENETRDLIQCTTRSNIDLSIAGDLVIFQMIDQHTGVVTALLPRYNELRRSHKLVAANIDKLWLIVALEPHYQFELIDRYLVVAENAKLSIGILINKIELSTNLAQVKHQFEMYVAAGYCVNYLSVKNQLKIDEFKTQLENKTQIFLGQSGVGKSSLINLLIPNLNLRINEISSKSKLGKHTTTATTLYHIPSGGNLIDSPGIREFKLDNLSNKEILSGFKEFQPFIGLCKFRNCAHINEPNCAIKDAVKSGKIHQKRYQSYLNLIT